MKEQAGYVKIEDEARLRVRLENCLQTILELKDDLSSIPCGLFFMAEFGVLESFMEKLAAAAVSLSEHEVRRVEAATSKFLGELKPLLTKNGIHSYPWGGMQ
ncbi:MAG: hypothetical protein LBQ63_04830 [Deltaproteobacteria bacterium]|jgi:hypothetical protein|nr:hypothetical protein [Deltaproteobacteria bacterium]